MFVLYRKVEKCKVGIKVGRQMKKSAWEGRKMEILGGMVLM